MRRAPERSMREERLWDMLPNEALVCQGMVLAKLILHGYAAVGGGDSSALPSGRPRAEERWAAQRRLRARRVIWNGGLQLQESVISSASIISNSARPPPPPGAEAGAAPPILCTALHRPHVRPARSELRGLGDAAAAVALAELSVGVGSPAALGPRTLAVA